jgi:hypothetical protein
MQIRRLMSTLAVLAAFTGILAPAAVAEEPTTGGDIPPRLVEAVEHRCAAVPDRIARVEERIARLQGDADTPGSIAWVEAWAERLRDYGLEDFADLLDARAGLKKQGLELGEQWLDHLLEVRAVCDDFTGDAG